MTVMLTRRDLVIGLAATALLAPTPTLGQAVPTPAQGLGPLYPPERPRDPDFDLTRIAGRAGRAKGSAIEVSGRVLEVDGRPIAGADVQIWQADDFGRYHRPRDNSTAPLDADFQGFGAVLTGADGAYRFRTIRPGGYANRTPHIHYMVKVHGRPRLVTQMYFAGEPRNDRDAPLAGIAEPVRHSAVIVPFDAAGQGRFDIVMAPA
ncbi:MAG: intradiol ring-cleavage dioxygenase [Alphaproteobacteria bacterium]|nr:intradiol ring-cleavage dioxygenase [Alphaproteobacteria bacterium]